MANIYIGPPPGLGPAPKQPVFDFRFGAAFHALSPQPTTKDKQEIKQFSQDVRLGPIGHHYLRLHDDTYYVFLSDFVLHVLINGSTGAVKVESIYNRLP